MLYTLWLYWKLADAIAAAAGGATTSMSQWSQIQLHLVRVLVATLFVGIASSAWDWGMMHFLVRRFESP